MNSLNESTSCTICHEEETIHAVAPCNHHICFKCSTRLRFLHHQYYCPICRADCNLVLFVHNVQNYSTIQQGKFIRAYKYKALFEDKHIEDTVNHLTAHDCNVCAREGKVENFNNFKRLQDHIRKQHQLFFCDICVEFIKIFSYERKAYTRHELGVHKRKGDGKDTSFKGHPLCQICDNRFLDTDELWRHLRKDHFFCHFCDSDGRHIYFGDYKDVKDHFQEEHFLCGEGECANVEFTNAFRSEIDFIGHKAKCHPKSGQRNHQRQSRVLPVEFNYSKEHHRKPNRERHAAKEESSDDTVNRRPQFSQSDVKAMANQEEVAIARAMSASLQQTTSTANTAIYVESVLDFPSLHGDATPRSSQSSPLPQKKFAAARAAGLVMVDDNEEFPGLASAPDPPPTPQRSKLTATQPKKATKPVARAAVKAKSNPWGNTEDEFPTLEGAKPKQQVHGWHFSKPQPKPTRPSFANNRTPVLNSANDFPTLAAVPAASSNLASIGSWIHTVSKTPAPAPEIMTSRLAPSTSQVNYYTSTPQLQHLNTSTSTATKSSTKIKKVKKKKQDSNISQPAKSGESAKELVATDDSMSNKKSSGKKTLSTEKANSVSTGTSAAEKEMKSEKKSVLEADKQSSQQSSVANGYAKSKSSSIQDAAESTQRPKQDITESSKRPKQEITESSKRPKQDVKEDGQKPATVDKASKLNAKSAGLSKDETLNVSPATSSVQEKSSKGSKISKKMTAIEAELNDDFPSIPMGHAKAGKNVNQKWDMVDFPSLPSETSSRNSDSDKAGSKDRNSDKTVTKSHISDKTKCSDPEPRIDLSKFSLDDYPSLSTSNGLVSKPPPGLNSIPVPSVAVSAPPGLGNLRPFGNGTTCSKPPGLVLHNPLSISSVASLINGSSPMPECNAYLEPVNFAQRNKKLSFKLKDLIYNDTDKFHKFKNYSIDFRGDQITARQFHDGCYQLLGKETFLEILPELLVLLPDISKQRALYDLCIDELVQFQNMRSWTLKDASLHQCDICKQVLLAHDAIHHDTQHGGGDQVDFPATSNSQAGPAVRNAW